MKKSHWPSALLLSLLVSLPLAGCGKPSPDELMQQVRAHVGKGEKKAAIIELKNLLADNPEHAQARLMLGQLYLETGELDAATIELNKAVERGADKIATTVMLAKAQLARGEAAKLLATLDPQRLPEAATSPQLIVLRAEALAASGKPDAAAAAYREALQRDPKFADASLGLAKLSMRQQKNDDAAAQVDRILQQTPANADALIMKADLLRIKGDRAGAKAAFQQALAADKSKGQAYFGLMALALDDRQPADARKYLTELRKLAPDTIFSRHFEALILLQEKNFDQALANTLEVLKTAPGFPPSNLLAADIEYGKGMYQQALAHLNAALAANPENISGQRLLIAIFLKQNEVDKAVALAARLADKHPDDPAVLGVAGEAFARKKDYTRAMGYFSRAAQLDPKNSAVRTRLALSRMAGGDSAQALTELQSIAAEESQIQADVLLALAHINKGAWAEADKAVAQIARKQPDNPIAYGLRASILLGKKDEAGARKELETVLKRHPAYLPAAINLARLDLQTNQFDAGRKRFEGVLAADPKNINALMAFADYLALRKEFQAESIAQLEKARKLSPTALPPVLALTQRALRAGDGKKALAYAQEGAAAHANVPDALDNLGQAQLATGDKNQALATYTKLVQLQPRSATALFRLGSIQSQLGDQRAAIASMRQALTNQPQHIDARVALVELLLREKQSKEALEIARDAQKAAPKQPIGLVLEGDVLLADKAPDAAAKLYRQALALADTAPIAIKLHNAVKKSGNAQEANTQLLKWLEKHPQEASVRLYLAEDALRDKRFNDAATQYEAADKLMPNSVLVLNNLAYVYQQLKHPRALEVANQALKLAPDSPVVQDTLGMILLDAGQQQKALGYLQRAADADKNNREIRLHLAEAYLKAGQKPKAKQELEKLAVYGDQSEVAATARKLLQSLQ